MYQQIIDKIKRRRIIFTVITVILFVAVLFLASDSETVINEVDFSHPAYIGPVASSVLIFLISVIGLVAISLTYKAYTSAITDECDPQKYIEINSRIMKPGFDLNFSIAQGLFYLGNFETAVKSFNQLLGSAKRNDDKLNAIGHIGRCCFMLGDKQGLQNAIKDYREVLAKIKGKLSYAIYENVLIQLELMGAIAENDKEKMLSISATLDSVVKTNLSIGFINYLKGIVAFEHEYYEESTVRFTDTADKMDKTYFGQNALWYLEEIKKKQENI